MSFDLGGKGKLRADINVTPLVDVVLVLLIIFMVVTPLLEREFIVYMPEQQIEDLADEAPPNQVVVILRADNRVEVNGEVVERADLEGRLRRSLARIPDRAMFFDADDQARYGEAVAVMDTARGAGARIIGTILESITSPAGEPAQSP